MQALRVHAFDQPPRLDTLPDPVPAAGEVRVRVQACGISFFDLLIARGGYQWRPDLPFTVGSEFAGVVDALGEGAQGLAIGDRVCGSSSIGAWTQSLCVPAAALNAVPAQAPLDEAAVLLTPYGTALYALRERGTVQRGETVLVLGATGSIGDAGVQVAKALGARVIAGASGEAKGQAACAAGADAAVDLSQPGWRERLKAVAPGGTVDVVVDPLGGDYTEPAFRSLGWGGRHLMIGFAGGGIPALRGNLALLKGASLVGVDARQFMEREPAAAAANLQAVCALYAQGRVRPLVQAQYPFERWREALAAVEDRRTIGRVALLWN